MAGKDVNEVGRLDEKKKKKREDLLNATYELFTSKGVFDTSISDIVKKANMAKGTFYLYFKDKYDIRNALITKKAGELFSVAYEKMYRKKFSSLEATVICAADVIIDQLNEDKTLLEFIAKNLQWGLFHKVLLEGENDVSKSFFDWYSELIATSGRKFKNHVSHLYDRGIDQFDLLQCDPARRAGRTAGTQRGTSPVDSGDPAHAGDRREIIKR